MSYRSLLRAFLGGLLILVLAWIFTSSLAYGSTPLLITSVSPSSSPEFVELYNQSTHTIDLDNYYFCYYSANRDSWTSPYRSKPFPQNAVILPHRFFLIMLGASHLECLPADWTPYSGKMLNADAGTIAILDGRPGIGNVVDAVAWGDTKLSRGTPIAAPRTDWAISRKPGLNIDQPFQDTKNNSLDFSAVPPSASNSTRGAILIQRLDSIQSPSYTITVCNASLASQTFLVSLESDIGFRAVPKPNTVRLEPGECVGITIIPADYDFYSLDLETSGLSPRTDSIIEVGWVHFKDGKIQEEYSSLVHYNRILDPFITFLTGITPAMLKTAPSLESVLSKLVPELDDHPVIYYSKNGFDWRFMESALASLELDMPGTEWISAYSWAREALPDLPDYRLETVTKSLGIEDQHHRALSDARMTGISFLEFIKRLSDKLVVRIYPNDCEESLAASAITIDYSLISADR